jgi:hypothetical protein
MLSLRDLCPVSSVSCTRCPALRASGLCRGRLSDPEILNGGCLLFYLGSRVSLMGQASTLPQHARFPAVCALMRLGKNPCDSSLARREARRPKSRSRQRQPILIELQSLDIPFEANIGVCKAQTSLARQYRPAHCVSSHDLLTSTGPSNVLMGKGLLQASRTPLQPRMCPY